MNYYFFFFPFVLIDFKTGPQYEDKYKILKFVFESFYKNMIQLYQYNFMCKVGWSTVPKCLVRHYSESFCEGFFNETNITSVDFE